MSKNANSGKVWRGKEKTVGEEDGYRILSYLLAGVLFYGGLGWLVDHYFHTRFALPLGIILGSVLSLYLVVKRFGNAESRQTSEAGKTRQGEESE